MRYTSACSRGQLSNADRASHPSPVYLRRRLTTGRSILRLLRLLPCVQAAHAALGVLGRVLPLRGAVGEDLLGVHLLVGGDLAPLLVRLDLGDRLLHEQVESSGRARRALLLLLLLAVLVEFPGALPQDAARAGEDVGDLLRSLRELREGGRELSDISHGRLGRERSSASSCPM